MHTDSYRWEGLGRYLSADARPIVIPGNANLLIGLPNGGTVRESTAGAHRFARMGKQLAIGRQLYALRNGLMKKASVGATETITHSLSPMTHHP
jgi:hypothetical protein